MIVIVAFTYNATTKVSYFRDRSLAVEGRLLAETYLRAQVRNQLLETFDVLYVSGIDMYEDRINQGKEEVQNKILDLKNALTESGVIDASFKADLDEVVNAYDRLQSTLDQGVALLKSGKKIEARQVLIDARENKFKKEFLEKISAIIEKESQISSFESNNLEQSIKWLQRILLLSAGGALLLSLILSTFISRSIGRRLGRIEKAAQRISSGDFDISLSTHGQDEVSTLSQAINKMAASLLEAKTQIIKQQELLIISSKMSSLGEMATGIAHEINTPLAVIALKADLLKAASNSADFTSNARTIVTDACVMIHKTTDRIAKIIIGLRAFARDGASDPFQKADLRSIVKDTLDLCSEKFRGSGVVLQVQMPEGELILSCRATQISQVLLNLLSNSFDAIQGNAEKLTEKWIKIEALDLGSEIELSVTDSGHGISAAIRSKLAQPFFTTKEAGKGTGLGLSISRGIVMDHGGRLILDEQSPHTRFVIVLPKDRITA